MTNSYANFEDAIIMPAACVCVNGLIFVFDSLKRKYAFATEYLYKNNKS